MHFAFDIPTISDKYVFFMWTNNFVLSKRFISDLTCSSQAAHRQKALCLILPSAPDSDWQRLWFVSRSTYLCSFTSYDSWVSLFSPFWFLSLSLLRRKNIASSITTAGMIQCQWLISISIHLSSLFDLVFILSGRFVGFMWDRNFLIKSSAE